MAWAFVKVYTAILDSSIARNVRVRHVFEDLLKLARPDGTIDMTLDAIARRTGEDPEIVAAAIEELCAPDAESRTEEFEGRRLIPLAGRAFGWWIVNYRKYVERGGSTERVRQYRERCVADQPDADEVAQKKRERAAERAARVGSQQEILDLYTSLWMARYKAKDPTTGEPLRPTLKPGDIVPAWSALRQLPPDERTALVREYLRDDDRLVVQNYHRLGLLAVRFDALRARRAGLAAPGKKPSAADVEKAAVKSTIERARAKAAQKRTA